MIIDNINGIEAFYNLFILKCCSLIQDKGSHKVFKAKDEFGDGVIELITNQEGITIFKMDMLFKESIEVNYTYLYDDLYFEVSYFFEGSLKHEEKDLGEIRFKPNHISIFLKEDAQGKFIFKGGHKISYISVSFFKRYFNKHKDELTNQLFSLRNELSLREKNELMKPHRFLSLVGVLFEQIHANSLDNILDHLDLELKSIELLLATINIVRERAFNDVKSKSTKVDVEALKIVRAIIEEEYATEITLSYLAYRAGVSLTKLKKDFRQVYHMTVFEYLKHIRLEKAKLILEQYSDMKISDVIYEVGYSNPGHFSRSFRNQFGVNPVDVKRSSKDAKMSFSSSH